MSELTSKKSTCNVDRFHTSFKVLHKNQMREIYIFFFLWRNSPTWARAAWSLRFLHYTKRHITVGRRTLDEGSDHRRDTYLTIHKIHNRLPNPRQDSNWQTANPDALYLECSLNRSAFHSFCLHSSLSLSFPILCNGLTCTTVCSEAELTFNYVFLNTSLHGPGFAKARIE